MAVAAEEIMAVVENPNSLPSDVIAPVYQWMEQAYKMGRVEKYEEK